MKLLRFYNSAVHNFDGQRLAETEIFAIRSSETVTLSVSSKIEGEYQSTNIHIDEQERDELVEFLQQLKFK